jgi:hypothetical protein
MKQLLLAFILIKAPLLSFTQKVDSICFHLYTDSLKKGTHNYINVDGRLSNGKWRPLTAKEISFSASYGSFEGNELIIPKECTEEKVTVKAVLKSEPAKQIETTIWVKKKPDDEKLPTKDDILKLGEQKKKKSKNKSPG